MPKAIEFRKGMGVKYNGDIWVVHNSSHVPKGKGRSYQQMALKSVTTGKIIDERFRTEEQLESAIFDRVKMEYLYAEGDHYVVMDMETFEQMDIPSEFIGDQSVYLMPNLIVEVSSVEGRIVLVELPNTVELVVTDVPPAVKGATVTNQIKDALCDGGARVKVPPFVENGQRIKVDTRTGEYLGRV